MGVTALPRQNKDAEETMYAVLIYRAGGGCGCAPPASRKSMYPTKTEKLHSEDILEYRLHAHALDM